MNEFEVSIYIILIAILIIPNCKIIQILIIVPSVQPSYSISNFYHYFIVHRKKMTSQWFIYSFKRNESVPVVISVNKPFVWYIASHGLIRLEKSTMTSSSICSVTDDVIIIKNTKNMRLIDILKDHRYYLL